MLHRKLLKNTAEILASLVLFSCGTVFAAPADPALKLSARNVAYGETDASAVTRAAETGASRSTQALTAEDRQIINGFLENFSLLNQIPRPSGHMEKISNFMADWARKQGLKPVQDDVLNVIFDVPATKGKKNLPLCILQAHIDMVCAAKDGVTYDPLNDPIKVIRNEVAGTLTADGTSLGADDGAGVAVIMDIVQGKMEHGPLRVIFTVNEENDMSGVRNVDAKYLQDARYLINVDSEVSDTVFISSAAGSSVFVKGKTVPRKPAGDQAFVLTLSGLTGGHSGIDINKGRMNAIRELARFLETLPDSGVTFELSEFSGGNASNAIPSKATAVLVINGKQRQSLEQAVNTQLASWKNAYAGIEDTVSLTLAATEMPAAVISDRDTAQALNFITEVINGVHTMSKTYDGLVESSSNLGIISISPGGLDATTYIRSSADDRLGEIEKQQTALVKRCGFTCTVDRDSDPWAYNPDSKLLKLTQNAYLELNKEPIGVEALHAALECGTFSKLNPSLDMISIGPDIKDVHSPQETLYLNSIPKTWKLLQKILPQLQ